MFHESYWSRISILCFLGSLPRAQSTVISQNLIDFPLFSALFKDRGESQAQSGWWEVRVSLLQRELLRVHCILPSWRFLPFERRRLSDRQYLILRWEAWDPFDMENSRRFMVQDWLNQTWEEQVRPLLVRPAHYPCWKCAQDGKAGLGSPIFWDKHCWASCCLLSDMVVNTKWWTSIKNAQETLGGVRNFTPDTLVGVNE